MYFSDLISNNCFDFGLEEYWRKRRRFFFKNWVVIHIWLSIWLIVYVEVIHSVVISDEKKKKRKKNPRYPTRHICQHSNSIAERKTHAHFLIGLWDFFPSIHWKKNVCICSENILSNRESLVFFFLLYKVLDTLNVCSERETGVDGNLLWSKMIIYTIAN